jgi:hypothetical protein
MVSSRRQVSWAQRFAWIEQQDRCGGVLLSGEGAQAGEAAAGGEQPGQGADGVEGEGAELHRGRQGEAEVGGSVQAEPLAGTGASRAEAEQGLDRQAVRRGCLLMKRTYCAGFERQLQVAELEADDGETVLMVRGVRF